MNVFSDVTYIELIIKRIVMQYSEMRHATGYDNTAL